MGDFDSNGTVVDDDDLSSVSYFPREAWNSTHDTQYSSFTAGSYHVTDVGGAYMSFTFKGTHVSYFSDKNNDHGDFLIVVDDGEPFTGTSHALTWSRSSLLLYSSPDLSPGTHTLTITNMQAHTALGLDYFLIRDGDPDDATTASSSMFTLPPGSSVSLTSDTSLSTGSVSQSTMTNSTGVNDIDDENAPSGISKRTVHIIAGFAIGVGICVLIAIIVWIRRCNRRRRHKTLPQHVHHPPGRRPPAAPAQRPAARPAAPPGHRRPLPQPPRPRRH
ncbi:hypothetical protein AURDEDRAFT_164268 [Auricularia subglabra TFB-10046 SS5]|nr:hypothetical protein AURDEDRAFT_164268 [Auricularia subglabra TFB-10046 SS5]